MLLRCPHALFEQHLGSVGSPRDDLACVLVRLEPGEHVGRDVPPVTASATGKAFAAFLPEAVSHALVEAELGASRPPNPSWADALQEIRESRCARQDAICAGLFRSKP